MQFRLYIGVPHPQTSLIEAHLAENADLLAEEGIALCLGAQACGILRKVISEFIEKQDPEAAMAKLRDELSIPEDTQRLSVVDAQISGRPGSPFGVSYIFPTARRRIDPYVQLFGQENTELIVGIQDLGEYIPLLYTESLKRGNVASFEEYLNGPAPENIDYQEYIYRCQQRRVGLPAYVFPLDEYPFLWRDILHVITAYSNPQSFVGTTPNVFVPPSLIKAEAFYDYLVENDLSKGDGIPEHWQSFSRTFDKSLENQEHDYWSDAFQNQLAEQFEEDLDRIAELENVEIIQRRVF